jgi:hypothetical protein
MPLKGHLVKGSKPERKAGVVVSTNAASKKPNYTVKDAEVIMADTHVQARIFTLAPGEGIRATSRG